MKYQNIFLDELVNEVIPFWENFSIDKSNGGFFTCIDDNNKVFDTDKFIWLQARQVWMFATLFEQVDDKKEWLELSQNGAEFLEKFGHDGSYNWYFSVTKNGKPLISPYNIFSYTFSCMAFGKLFKITNNEFYKKISLETLNKIQERSSNPKDKWNKAISGTRDLKNFALPMILCNLYSELGDLVDQQERIKIAEDCVDQIFNQFYDLEKKIIRENVYEDGNFSDSFDGRLINPGHGLEAMWFIMDLGQEFKRDKWIQKAIDIALNIIDHGWDSEMKGIFYFLDSEGHSPQQLEWNQKLWWVHLEALVCFLRAYELSGSKKCFEWFQKIYNYTWSNFRDPNGGEWYGYLQRNGEKLLNLKGGKWKGCFHVPRALLILSQISKRLDI